MKPSLLTKLETLADRHEEVSALLSDGETIADQERFRNLSREYSELEDVVKCYGLYSRAKQDLEEARQMLDDIAGRSLMGATAPADEIAQFESGR